MSEQNNIEHTKKRNVSRPAQVPVCAYEAHLAYSTSSRRCQDQKFPVCFTVAMVSRIADLSRFFFLPCPCCCCCLFRPHPDEAPCFSPPSHSFTWPCCMPVSTMTSLSLSLSLSPIDPPPLFFFVSPGPRCVADQLGRKPSARRAAPVLRALTVWLTPLHGLPIRANLQRGGR